MNSSVFWRFLVIHGNRKTTLGWLVHKWQLHWLLMVLLHHLVLQESHSLLLLPRQVEVNLEEGRKDLI